MQAARQTSLGVAGLLAFEALLTLTLAGFGSTDFAAISGASALLLAFALLQAWRGDAVPAWVLGGLAATTLARAAIQAAGGFQVLHVASFLVPLGFAVAAWGVADPRQFAAGLGLVAVCRAVFAATFLAAGITELGLPNLLGAAGALLWAAAAWRGPGPAPAGREPAGGPA